MKYTGSCHCQAIRIEVEAPAEVVVHRCDCSICIKSGHLHLIVPRDRMRLISGEESLGLYQFNTGVAKHYFCKVCGIKPFYVPRSNPDGYSINVRCLDPVPEYRSEDFDGRNWEKNAHTLRHLSDDS